MCAFLFCLRISEILAPTWNDVRFIDEPSGGTALSILIRSPKTNQEKYRVARMVNASGPTLRPVYDMRRLRPFFDLSGDSLQLSPRRLFERVWCRLRNGRMYRITFHLRSSIRTRYVQTGQLPCLARARIGSESKDVGDGSRFPFAIMRGATSHVFWTCVWVGG